MHHAVAPATVHQRVDFASSMIDGRTVRETNPESNSAREIAELWAYVSKRLGKTQKDKRHEQPQRLPA